MTLKESEGSIPIKNSRRCGGRLQAGTSQWINGGAVAPVSKEIQMMQKTPRKGGGHRTEHRSTASGAVRLHSTLSV